MFVLGADDDAALLSELDGVATLESAAYDLDATIDLSTGELLGFALGHRWGSQRVWFVGRMTQPLFPARHPLERRARTVRGQPRSAIDRMPESADTSMLLYESAAPIRKADAELFRWQPVASTLLDHSTGEVLGHDGRPDPEATAAARDLTKRLEKARAPLTTQDAEARRVPRKTAWSAASRVGVAVSAAMLALAAALFIRRRMT
jgi:hypothetical protein